MFAANFLNQIPGFDESPDSSAPAFGLNRNEKGRNNNRNMGVSNRKTGGPTSRNIGGPKPGRTAPPPPNVFLSENQTDSINDNSFRRGGYARKSMGNVQNLGGAQSKTGENTNRKMAGGNTKRESSRRAENINGIPQRIVSKGKYVSVMAMQPTVIGTNVLPPKDTTVQSHSSVNKSPRHHTMTNQRRPSDASIQSSSFCFINQGDIKEDFKEAISNSFTPEPNTTITDFCSYCCNKQKHSQATHFCNDCGLCGRYLCQYCLGFHNSFLENHHVTSLSGQMFRKKDDQAMTEKPAEHKETVQDNKEEKNEEQPNIKTPALVKEVSIKCDTNEQSCQITGFCQLDNGTILVTEMNNKAVKTLHSSEWHVTNTVYLSSYPMGICCVGSDEALVVLFKSMVQYITVGEEINLTRKKDLKHDCECIAYCNGKIFIGGGKTLYIYDKKWRKLDEITNHLFGEDRVFSDEFSIAVTEKNENKFVYVADVNNGMYSIEITKDDLAQTWKFKDHNAFKASGICTDSSGNVYVCDRGSDRLIKMTEEGMILAILLDSSSGAQPLNIPFYDKKNDKIIVALSGKNYIKVFSFK